MSNNNLVIFASDLNENTGEGILGRLFIRKLFLKYNKPSIDIITPNQKFKYKGTFENIKNTNQNNIFHKYFIPIIGALKLRHYKNRKEIIFVNYLPLWNFLIFLILPKKTVLGPITGSKIVKDKNNINTLVRRYLFPLLFNLSIFIINNKFKKIIFSTNLLKGNFYKIKKILLHNFVLCSFNPAKIHNEKKIKKKYDLIFYNRKHRNKFNKDLVKIIEALSKTKKICIIGDKFNSLSKNIFNFGYISRKKVNLIMQKTRFVMCGQENLYSLFAIDGYNNYCQLILDKNLKKFEFANSQNFHFTDYNFSNKNLKHILQILEKRRIQKDLEFKKKLLNKKKNIDKFIELY
ncbi:hypothetical protein [Candidatus Pelagibacter sp.]|uniref:hypothetical protein n=1 Tax=Candidatus Pelagibacter sp. TaxID=2024849 RepID=UPI003F82CC33